MKKKVARIGILLLVSLVLAVVLEALQLWSQPAIHLSVDETAEPEGEALDLSLAKLENTEFSGTTLKTLGKGASVLIRFDSPKSPSVLAIRLKKHTPKDVPVRVYCSPDGNTFGESDMTELEVDSGSLLWNAELPQGEYAALRIEADGKLYITSLVLQETAAVRKDAPEPFRFWRAGIAAVLLFFVLSVLRYFRAAGRLRDGFLRAAASLRTGWKRACFRLLVFFAAGALGYSAVRWLVSGSFFGQIDIPRQLFCAAAGICAGLLAAFPKALSEKPEKLFVAFSLLAGMLMVFLFPNDAGVNWDAEYHYEQAVIYSYLGEERLTEADTNFINFGSLGAGAFDWEEGKNQRTWNQSAYEKGAHTEETGMMLNSVYELFAGTGLYAGRVLHLSWDGMLWLGKLFNLMVYTACGYFAIRRLKAGKMILACVLLIPINLFLASTFSYDPGVTGFLALSLAYYFAEWQEPDRKLTRSHAYIITGAAAFALLTKAFYAPVLLLTIFLPRGKWASSPEEKRLYVSRKRYLFLVSAAVLAGLIPYILPLFRGNVVSDMRGGSSDVPLAQVRYILEDPFRFLGILFRFQRTYFSPATSRSLLTMLGSQGYGPYWQVLYGLLVALAFTDKKPCDRALERKPAVRIAGLLLLYLCACIICLCLYVSFTVTGLDTISGVQTRYLLPIVFPVLMLAGSGPAAKLLRIDRPWKQRLFNGTAFLVSLAVLFCTVYTVCVGRF